MSRLEPVGAAPRPARRINWPWLVLLVLALAFAAWFSAYSIRLHDAHLTHKSDLGQIDLAIWNTAHGRLLQEVVRDHTSTRLTDHAEPIFAPVSLVFWLWDDVRALLVLQAAALALGALPIYLLARSRLRGLGLGTRGDWAALLPALTYLLAPSLQAAAVSEFHAFGLAPPLIAWALWAVERRQWGRFALAAILVMAVQEGLALLGVLLGVYAAARAWFGPGRRLSGLAVAAATVVVGLAWFYAATFVIIPHFANQAYGISQTPYAARYGALGDSFGDVLRKLITRPGLVAGILAEPQRSAYLLNLLAPTAFFALLGPEVLALSLPLLLANALSTFALQYGGGLHYSAPLVPYVSVAGIYGLERLIKLGRVLARRAAATPRPLPAPGRAVSLAAVLGLIGVGMLTRQAVAGFTPMGAAYWRLSPGGWPAVTAHDRLLDRFLAQVPAGAPGSTTSDLYPHLSHRELLYPFPYIGQSTWVLVDVTGETGRPPGDVWATLQGLTTSGWHVADAADGYILLQKEPAGAPGPELARLPAEFYDFVRAGATRPKHQLDITFGGRLRLVGYDVLDDPAWRRTALRFYWQALERLPENLKLNGQVLAPDGRVANDTAQRPLVAPVWYPPEIWPPGQIMVTTWDPWYLPATWAPAWQVSAGDEVWQPVTGAGGEPAVVADGGRAILPGWERSQGVLRPLAAPAVQPVTATFAGPDWQAQLTGYAAAPRVAPGQALPITLRWQTAAEAAAPRDYTVFMHLEDAAGNTVATGDATPTWFHGEPTSRWPTGTPVWDSHTLTLPANLAPGRYRLVLGWYDWQSGQRLPLVSPAGSSPSDAYVLQDVEVSQSAAPAADIACLAFPESCGSQR